MQRLEMITNTTYSINTENVCTEMRKEVQIFFGQLQVYIVKKEKGILEK